jgi:Domain of unknown function (DUF4476)
MKTILIAVSLLLIGQVAYEQNPVTIKTTGNRNKQLIIDNKTYAINNSTTTAVSEIMIPDLAAGRHTIAMVRNNQSGTTTRSTFVTRNGYKLQLSIAANGSISTIENRITSGNHAGGMQLSATAYANLLAKVKAKRSSADRSTIIENHFTASNKRITATQASQLIKLVNSESLRLKLARLSYAHISDTENFALVSNLLNSTANRATLNEYIVTIDNNPTGTEIPLTNAEFNLIYQEVVVESTITDRFYYLTNFFDRETSYYTAAQANQLLALINNQADRNILIAKAYRGVTDKQNFNHIGTVNNSMSDINFTNLYNSVKNTNSTTTRYNLLGNAFNSTSNYFTVYQAKQLLYLVNTENDRLPFAKNVWNNITDPDNFSQIYDLFSSASNRNDLLSYVTSMQNGNTGSVKIAMSETDFNKLYRDIQYSFGIGVKYSSLTDIFNTATNYFTVAQTKKLIEQVSSESNRLELAKLSYNNITDPTNFSDLYPIFSSQASKDELMNYVNSNASIN